MMVDHGQRRRHDVSLSSSSPCSEICNKSRCSNSFSASDAACCDFACAHEVSDVLLQELVVVVKLVVFLLDSLYTVEKQ